MNKLVIVGASGHGRAIADIALKTGYSDIVFLDDSKAPGECRGFDIVGSCSDADKYAFADFIIAIGNSDARQKIHQEFEKMGLNIVSLIHPSSVIGSDVRIGTGSVVMAGAVINPCARIGRGCIINTCSSVDHDCEVGDFSHVSVGAHIAGTVKIGENTWIGAGATVSNNIDIVSGCVIGAGAVVVKDIKIAGTYVGVPVKKIVK